MARVYIHSIHVRNISEGKLLKKFGKHALNASNIIYFPMSKILTPQTQHQPEEALSVCSIPSFNLIGWIYKLPKDTQVF